MKTDITVTSRTIKLFWDKVDILSPEECWVWKAATDEDGYGLFTVPNGKSGGDVWRAHRFSYLIHHGFIPPDNLICHECDNPSCVSPFHLWAGTPKDNSRDMQIKRRAIGINAGSKNGMMKWPQSRTVGELQHAATLKDSQVVEIKIRLTKDEQVVKLAKEFDVHKNVISNIKRGLTWRHIPWPDGFAASARSCIKTPIEIREQIVELLQQEIPACDIARQLQIPKHQVFNVKYGRVKSTLPEYTG